MKAELSLIDRFFEVLAEEIRRDAPEYLTSPFTVAEIYQSLVPYRTHRDRIGAEMNGDYEDALLRLLAGEGGYLELESETARERIRLELRSANPNTGLYREFAAVGVRVDLGRVAEVDVAEEQTELDVAKEPPGASPASEAPTSPAPSASGSAGPPTDPTAGTSEPAAAAGRAAEAAGDQADRSADEGDVPGACPECEQELPPRDSLRFCPFCGINVFVVPCGECGEVLERSWSFCVACGTPA